MYGQRRSRSQCSSRHVSSSEDESIEGSFLLPSQSSYRLFAELGEQYDYDDEPAFYEELDYGDDEETTAESVNNPEDLSGAKSIANESRSGYSISSLDDNASTKTLGEVDHAGSSNDFKSDLDFVKYVMSLPSDSPPGRHQVTPPPTFISEVPEQAISKIGRGGNKVGLDHLDNLCRLLEQLGDLKQRNQSLERRVEYLEGLRMLHDTYKKTVNDGDGASNENIKAITGTNSSKDYRSGIYRKKKAGHRSKHKSRKDQLNNGRGRSKSVGNAEMGAVDNISPSKKQPNKSSKWTKMKEALGLDRTMDQQTSIGSGVRKSRTIDAVCHLPNPDDLTDGWTPSPSPSADPEKFRLSASVVLRRPDSVLSDDSSVPEESEMAMREEINRLSVSPVFQSYQEDKLKSLPIGQRLEVPVDLAYHSSPSPTSTIGFNVTQKSQKATQKAASKSESSRKYVDKDGRKYKSPWGKVRDIIHTRKGSLKQNPTKSGVSSGGNKNSSEIIDIEPSSGISVEISTVSEDEASKATSIDSNNLFDVGFDETNRKISTQSEPGPRIHDDPKLQMSPATRKKTMTLQLTPHHQGGLECVSSLQRSNSYSGPKGKRGFSSYQSNSKWSKVKRAFIKRKNKEDELPDDQMTKNNGMIEGLNDVFLKVNRSLSVPNRVDYDESSSQTSGNLSPDEELIDQRSQEDRDRINDINDSETTSKKNSPSNNRNSTTSSITTPTLTLEELQKNLSQDFSKKMEAWERIKAKEGSSKTQTPTGDRKTEFGSVHRKEKSPKHQKDREKALQWVEKELQKIAREQQRLAKEKRKYQEREERLEKLKGSMIKIKQPKSCTTNPILIKTSAGEFRFEGISDTFTKKLYEWEEKRGVDPELSTMALLSSGVHNRSGAHYDKEKSPAATSLHSSLSRNSSLCSVDKYVSGDRAYCPCEVTTLIDEKEKEFPDVAKISPKWYDAEEPIEQTANIPVGIDECCGLWDENMSLLERLKIKENECKQLGQKLNELDGKLDEMMINHNVEVESYKKRLTEMKISLFNSRNREDGCFSAMQLAEQLKNRVQELDSNLNDLTLERQFIQSTFTSYREEQNALAEDLVKKMQELHKINITGNDEENRNEDAQEIMRINELTSQLVNQAQDLEESMSERNEMIDKLRWQVLNKYVDNLKLKSNIYRENTGSGAKRAKRRKEQYQTWTSSHGLLATPDILNDTMDKEKFDAITYRGALSSLPTKISAKIQELQIELKKFQSTKAKNAQRRSKERSVVRESCSIPKIGADECVDGAEKRSKRKKKKKKALEHEIILADCQTKVSKAVTEVCPLTSSPLQQRSSSSTSSLPVDTKAKTASKHITSTSSETPLDSFISSIAGEYQIGNGSPLLTAGSCSTRKISLDDSFGKGSRCESNDPMNLLKKSSTDPSDKFSSRSRRLKRCDSSSGIPVYTMLVPKTRKESVPEINCTLVLNQSEKLKSKYSLADVDIKDTTERLVEAQLKSVNVPSPRSPSHERDRVFKEPRLKVRELAAQYDRKVTEMQSPKQDRRNQVEERQRQKEDCPMSPSARARMARIRKAREEFMSKPSSEQSIATSSTDKNNEDNSSMSSACEVVMRRTAENCRETRRRSNRIETDVVSTSSRGAKQKPEKHSPKQLGLSGTSTGAKSSFFNNIRLRKNKKKKDASTAAINEKFLRVPEDSPAVTALCRQSLFVDMMNEKSDFSPGHISPGPNSCPASPEMKVKSSSKPNWLHRFKPK